jgi:hypothetical protein
MTPNFFWFIAALVIIAVICGAMGQWLTALWIIAAAASLWLVASIFAALACVALLLLLKWAWNGGRR